MIALVFLLSIFLVACGGKEGGIKKDTGNSLIYGRGADSKKLDPIQVTDGESLQVTQMIYDTLVQYKDENTEVQPGLAEKWENSADGKVWTFHLRKNVKFHDGTPFNADAVVFNFERWMDKNHPQHKGGEFTYYPDMFGGYKGDSTHVINKVSKVDDHTVKFELNRPLGPFLANIAMPPFAIGSPEAIKKDPEKFNENPVGTGPYKFVEWKKNDTITLEKNPDYWVKGLPKTDKLIFKSIPDNTARFNALKSGDIDLMNGMNPTDAPQVEKDSKLQLFKQQGMNVAYLSFNMKKKPFDNPKVRQAISYAVNKEGIIKNFYAGLAEPAINPYPSFMMGYNKDVKEYEFNLDKAKQLLKEAGFEKGLKLKLHAPQDPRPYLPNGKKVAEFLKEDFKKIGIDAEIVTAEWKTYQDQVKSGQHELALYGWNGDNGDPDNFLYVLLDKNNAREKDASNISYYMSEEVHKLLVEAQSTVDQKKREELYKKAQEIIKKDAPWVPLVHATVPVAGKKELKGFFPHPTSGYKLYKVSR
ncbi:ABC transporter substrate-binding protein [Thermoflavimicrobium daqui]|uniref:ABC transporter substrate-binding protein n=2 Tax=Thermoflavimicrobium daqui TaxID=2137476 RepID=A0A364KA41_9BACL|nr:ABC transporter substrate-binding protein [Thermoflavimicrobium daqui]